MTGVQTCALPISANMQLQQQLANAQQPVVEEAEEVVVTDANIAPRTVFFKIGSDKLSPQEEMNLSYLASKMKEFPNMTYTINGYADSATGTPSINQKLSLERAQAVKDLLVKKYGISADRLSVAAGGGVDKVLVCLSIPVRAQNTDNNIIGIVVDKSGNPVYGASVNVEGGAVETRVETDKDGKFEIAVEKGQRLSVVSVDKGSTTVVAKTDGPMTIVMGYAAQTIDVGANRTFSRHESTAAVSTTYNEEFNKRSSRNISNSLYGYGLGLTTLQNAASTGLMADPTFYVRGLQSLSSSTPLVLVDGLERDMSLVSPEEVESVSILKDAAAVALYGYKGVNGAILITTKRGKYKTKEITFTYDHIINTQSRRPEFVDAATYASAVNEARGYEGLGARYTPEEVDAFRNGVGSGGASRMYPYLYPNVNWIDETFKDRGVSNKYTIEFRGGGAKFRYYTMANLLTDKGFIKTPNANDGYSTQNMYSRANLRTNLDIDLTATTKLKLNLLGTLSESRIPGASVNLWDMIYSIPSAAFPVRTEDDSWGGSTTWAGTSNPVAQSQGAAYSKGHSRSLFADLTLSQDLSGLLKGLDRKSVV